MVFHLFPLRQQKFIDLLQVIALGLLASSFIYLIAANWWMIPRGMQLSIPLILLFLTAITSVFYSHNARIRQSLDCICGLMLGLSLAVIGQVYQTGADSYLLFLLWSVLLLPWLLRPNIGIFCLLSIVSQLALFLYFKQMHLLEQSNVIYLAGLNTLALLCAFWCLKQYAALSYVFLLFFAVISAYSMFRFISAEQWFYLLSSFLLPVSAFIYLYLNKQPLGSSLAALSIGISSTIWLVHIILEQNFALDSAVFFALALLIFAWFALLSCALVRLLPQTNFYVIPLAFGAWLAGILLATSFLMSWGTLSLLLGAVFIVASSFILRKYRHYFARQLAYCLLISGQVALMWHSYELTKITSIVFAVQLAILGLCLYLRSHWFFIALQLIATYITAWIVWFDLSSLPELDTQLYIAIWTGFNLLCYSLIFILARIADLAYRRSVMLLVLVIVVMRSLQYQLGLTSHFALYQGLSWNTLLSLLWVAASAWFILKPQLKAIPMLAVTLLGMMLSLLGYFEVYLLLLILAWAIQARDKLVYACALLILMYILWQLYYLLDLSFLFKALSIFISALLIFVLHFILQSSLQKSVHAPDQDNAVQGEGA